MRRERGPVAARRRRVRRRGAAVGARCAAACPDLERADSVTVDPHKWFFQAYDIGGLVVRDGAHLAATFGGRSPEYYRGGDGSGRRASRATTTTRRRPAELLQARLRGHPPMARAEAVDVLEAPRDRGFGRLDRGQRRPGRASRPALRRGRRLRGAPAVPELSVVCFRHLPGGREAALGLPPGDLDAHQDRLQRALEDSGDGWLTTTRLRGATYLRAGIVNYLSTEDDIDRLLDVASRPGLGRHERPGGRSTVLSIATGCPVAAAASVANSTSSTWYASAPDARWGRPWRMASIMSASPTPRPTSPSNRNGTAAQASSPDRLVRTAPSKVFGSPSAIDPPVPWISMCGTSLETTSNEARKLPTAPRRSGTTP